LFIKRDSQIARMMNFKFKSSLKKLQNENKTLRDELESAHFDNLLLRDALSLASHPVLAPVVKPPVCAPLVVPVPLAPAISFVPSSQPSIGKRPLSLLPADLPPKKIRSVEPVSFVSPVAVALPPDPVVDPTASCIPDPHCLCPSNIIDQVNVSGPVSVCLSSIVVPYVPALSSLHSGYDPVSFRDKGSCISFQFASKNHLDVIIASFQEYGDILSHYIKFYPSYFLVLDVDRVLKDVLINKYHFINTYLR